MSLIMEKPPRIREYDRANMGGFFKEIKKGVYEVQKQEIEEEHMGIVPGVYLMRFVLGGEFEANKFYNVKFSEMLKPNMGVGKGQEITDKLKKSFLFENNNKQKLYVTVTCDIKKSFIEKKGIKINDEHFLDFDRMQIISKKGGIEHIFSQEPEFYIKPEDVKKIIPHRGDFLFAEDCQRMFLGLPEEKTQKVLFQGNIKIDRGKKLTGLECLIDAAAQIACLASEIRGKNTIFRNIKEINFTPEAIWRDKKEDFNGRFIAKGYLCKKNNSFGKAKLRVEDENGIVIFTASEFGSVFMEK